MMVSPLTSVHVGRAGDPRWERPQDAQDTAPGGRAGGGSIPVLGTRQAASWAFLDEAGMTGATSTTGQVFAVIRGRR